MAMMPNSAGTGSVPMAIASDPVIKCEIDNCQFVGNSICDWPNCAWLEKKTGGCKKRFCYNHRYEKFQAVRIKHSMYTMTYRACSTCATELEDDV